MKSFFNVGAIIVVFCFIFGCSISEDQSEDYEKIGFIRLIGARS